MKLYIIVRNKYSPVNVPNWIIVQVFLMITTYPNKYTLSWVVLDGVAY